jgi:hypothetical protein
MKNARWLTLTSTLALALVLGLGWASASETAVTPEPATQGNALEVIHWLEPVTTQPPTDCASGLGQTRLSQGPAGLCDIGCYEACWATMDQCIINCGGQGILCKSACADEKDRCVREDCGCFGGGGGGPGPV